MTCNKKLVSIFRHGINNDNIGPIAKASFEETSEMFLKAARHGELDEMRGVSANVMCGQTGYYGTHAFNVLVDMAKFRSLPDVPQQQRKSIQESMKQTQIQTGPVQTIDNGLSQFDVKMATDPCAKSNLLDDDYDMGF
jgi:DNA-directed RNA polymerase beta' subunit